MAKIYEYILRLQDQASTTLNRVGAATDSTLRKTEALQGAVGKLNNVLGAVGVTMGLAGLYQAGKHIVSLASDLEQTTVAFEVMMGSADQAARMINNIRNMADVTPFETADLTQAAQVLMNFGVAQAQIIPIMKALGDVSGGNKDRFSRLALVYAQTQSAGRLMGQDLLQYVNAGFNPLQILAEKTGKSISTLKTEMEKGSISAQMVSQAFALATGEGGKFHNMMEKQSHTLAGRWSTFVDRVNRKLTELGASTNSVLGDLLDGASKMMANIQPILTALMPFWQAIEAVFISAWGAVQNFFTQITNLISAITGAKTSGDGMVTTMNAIAAVLEYLSYPIQFLATAITQVLDQGGIMVIALGAITAAQWLWNLAMAANPIGATIAVIAILGGTINYLWEKFGWFRGAIYATWEAIKGFGLLIKDFIIDRIKGILSGLGGLGKALMQFFSGDWKNAWETAKKATGELVGVDALKNAYTNAKKIGTNVSEGYNKGVAEIAEKENKKREQLQGALELKKEIESLYHLYHQLDGKIGSKYIQQRKGLAAQMEKIRKGSFDTLNDSDYSGVNDNKELGTGGGSAAVNQSTKAVSSGGTRNTAITIHLGNLVENLNFNGGLKENVNDVRKQVEEVFMQMLYAAESAG